jgi:nucleoside-diphosphate-sugar epimerase
MILLTGGNGFLGKNILHKVEKIYDTKTLSKSFGDYIFSLEKAIPNFNEKFKIVIHLAGVAHVSIDSGNSRNIFHEVNVIGTKNLLTGLEMVGVPDQFIFVSSVAVYGKKFGSEINESSELFAKDPYGRSKIDAERLVINWCKFNNVVCTILRLPLVVGSNPPGNLGAMINGIESNRYFNIGDGNARKSMVLAKDVANFILKAGDVGGIFNLTDGYHPSFKELSNKISYQLGKKPPFALPKGFARIIAWIGDFIGSTAPLNSERFLKITTDLTFDDSKAREAFGWNPTPVLEGFKIY